jgi:hypothetical protein
MQYNNHNKNTSSGGWTKSKYREQFICLSAEFRTALTGGQEHS